MSKNKEHRSQQIERRIAKDRNYSTIFVHREIPRALASLEASQKRFIELLHRIVRVNTREYIDSPSCCLCERDKKTFFSEEARNVNTEQVPKFNTEANL